RRPDERRQLDPLTPCPMFLVMARVPNPRRETFMPAPEIRRETLFGKLNPVAYQTIEAATLFCKMRRNPYVELVHWVHQLLEHSESDWWRVLEPFGVDAGRLSADMTQALERLPRGSTSVQDL